MKTTIMMTSIMAAVIISTIALIVSFSQTTEITAAETPQGNGMYIFGEGVYPVATFSFKDRAITYEFQAFTQVTNLFGSGATNFQTRSTSPEFTLQRLVGDTPYLHHAVDETFAHNGRNTISNYDYKEFDVTIDMVKDGQPIRTLKYGDCSISNYKIATEFDKEEGYVTGKTGFAVMETYTFTCLGFEPTSPTYDELMETSERPY